MFRHFLFAVAIIGLIVALTPKTEATPLYEKFSLRNGMQVIVFPKPNVPAVSHMVWYKVGAIDEEAGKSGLAHFLEHLMFRGTESIPPGEFSKIIARMGGVDNAFTGYDYTAYYQQIATEHLPKVMEMEAERMRGLRLDPADIVRERDVVLEERAMRLESSPEAQLRVQSLAALFLNHPYGRPVIGWREETSKLTEEDARAFYDRYYNPANAILIISGDVTGEHVERLAKKYYGNIPAGIPYSRQYIPEPKPLAERRVHLSHPQVKQPVWRRYVLAPSLSSPPEMAKYAMPLNALSYLLGEDKIGYLNRVLVSEKQLAVAVDTGYDAIAAGASHFGISIVPRDGVDMDTLEKEVMATLEQFASEKIEQRDLVRVKNQLKANAIFAREGLQGMGLLAGQLLTAGLSLDYIDTWASEVDAVTPAQVRDALQTIVLNKAAVIGILEPEPEPEAQPEPEPVVPVTSESPASTPSPEEADVAPATE